MEVLLIVPCLNEVEHIKSLSEKFSPFLQSSPSSRMIFVDGGSTDGTIEQIRAIENEQIVYLNNEKKIQSAAINLAVKEFGGTFDYFIRIDAHGDYPDNYVERLLDEAIMNQADSVVVSMDTVGKSGFQKLAADAQNSKLGNGGSAHRNQSLNGKWVDHGHHALMRVDAFLTVGGYDESFVANEDAEIDARLIKAGFKIWLTARTFMTYYPRDNAKALFKQYLRYGIGRASNCLKHNDIPKVRQLLPIIVFPSAILLLFSSLHWILSIPFSVWFFACLMVGVLQAVKVRDLTLVASSFVAMLMHFSWSLGFIIGLFRYSQRS
ncbi:glycosyltransferase family 2 protein [Vibrio sinaloensis]|uniref:glycosyltransferase family 2 protein n=1 Tax=Photobacterium sp. (strain ATCC 43367) TaxID=379097 RepID=UPI0035EEECC6